MVHGDDFMSVGTKEAARQFRQKLEARFEIKTRLIWPQPDASSARAGASGRGEDVQSEGRVLNRIVRWTSDGWEIEPDQRHADIIVHELQLHESRAVSTPGEPEARHEEEENEKPLSPSMASQYRALSARANYLAADRTDIMYAVKGICRFYV